MAASSDARTVLVRSVLAGGAALGGLVLLLGLLVRFEAVPSPSMKGIGLALGAFAALASIGLPAWLLRDRRGLLYLLPSVLAGLAGLAVAASGRLDAGLEAVGGAALWSVLFSFLLWRPEPTGPSKARLLRARGKALNVPVADLAPGDRVRVPAGQVVPVDGTVQAGRARLERHPVGLPAMTAQPGDPVFAGVEPDGELEVSVERVAEASLLARQRTHLRELGALPSTPLALARVFGAVGVALVGGGVAYRAFGATSLADIALGLLLAAAALTLPAVVETRRRRTQLQRMAAAGFVPSRAADLERVLGTSKWQVDPELLSLPGSVEVVAFGEVPKGELLAIAGALVSEIDHPDAPALRRALSDRGRAPARGAAFSVRGEVVMGTVEGRRHHLGPREALAKVGIKVPKALQGTLTFLEERGGHVLLVASPDAGVLGAFGLDTDAAPAVAEAGRALRAQVGLGGGERVRAQAAAKAGLELATKAPDRKTAVLLHEDAVVPEKGLPVRVVRPAVGLGWTEGPPRLLAPSLADWPSALAQARAVPGTVMAWGAAVSAVALAAGLLVLGQLVPAAGAALSLLAYAAVTIRPARRDGDAASTPTPSVDEIGEEEVVVDVTLSGIEAVSEMDDEATVIDPTAPPR